MARSGEVLVATLRCCSRDGASGRQHRRARQRRRALHPLARGHAHLQGLPRLSRLDLRLAQRDGRARHPRPLSPGAAATSSRSTSASRSTAGWPTRRARSPSGTISEQCQNLLAATEESLHAGVAQCRPGNRMGDVSNAIQTVAEGAGLARRPLARRPRGRAQHARGPPGAQLRQARQGPAAGGGHGARDRADDHRRAPGGARRRATAGRSSPRTARRPRTSSSPSPITADGPRVLTPWHLRAPAQRAEPLADGLPAR